MRCPTSFPSLALLPVAAVLLSGCFFVDDDRGLPCDTVVTECWDVCDTYCDPWGCWDECFTECEDTCVSYSQPPIVVVVDDRECVTDRDCPNTHECRSDLCIALPETGRAALCEPCVGHSDCEDSGALCLEFGGGAEGYCGSACGEDRDCPSGFECLAAGSARQCVPTSRECSDRSPVAECDRDNDCGGDEICEAGECVEAPTDECSTDRDCPEPEVCVAGSCASLGTCAEDADCGAGEVCEDGLCAAELSCSRDRDCTEGQACVEGECVDPEVECATDRDCSESEVCIDGDCITPAVREECDFSSDCEDGACIDGLCRAECGADSDCNADEACRGGICAPRPEPECRTGADCGGDEFLCVDGQCRDICTSDAACGFGLICRSGFCDDDPAVECRNDLECGADQRCEEGMCFFTCRASCNCPSGLTCDGDTGLCESRPAPSSCESDCDCPSGMACADNACVER
ncbi:MAG: hypothetical protein ACI81R_000885 [Bradymonadia bacterium]|jgi:hypothetical protein